VSLIQADARAIPLKDETVQTVVTSPPYWGGIRDYGTLGQIGLERNPIEYVASLLDVFGEVRRVLKPSGTVWLNLSDVYAASGKGGGGSAGKRKSWDSIRERKGFRMPPVGYKMKDLTLCPFLVADTLRTSGWYLRAVVIWRKEAAVEPMRLDRPAVSHEYLFMLAKSEMYYALNPQEKWWGHSVWTIKADHYGSDHPAMMPRELVRRCLVCSSRPGDLVLDPFCGSGTSLRVAASLDRRAVGLDLSMPYLRDIAKKRTSWVQRELKEQLA